MPLLVPRRDERAAWQGVAAHDIPAAGHLLEQRGRAQRGEEPQPLADDGLQVGQGAGFGVADAWGRGDVPTGEGCVEFGLEAGVGCRVGEEEEEGGVEEGGDCVGAGEAFGHRVN